VLRYSASRRRKPRKPLLRSRVVGITSRCGVTSAARFFTRDVCCRRSDGPGYRGLASLNARDGLVRCRVLGGAEGEGDEGREVVHEDDGGEAAGLLPHSPEPESSRDLRKEADCHAETPPGRRRLQRAATNSFPAAAGPACAGACPPCPSATSRPTAARGSWAERDLHVRTGGLAGAPRAAAVSAGCGCSLHPHGSRQRGSAVDDLRPYRSRGDDRDLGQHEAEVARRCARCLGQWHTVRRSRLPGHVDVYALAVDFLLRGRDPASLSSYLEAIGRGTPWREAFAATFGLSLESFYADFAAYRQTL
jgi:hypothetical protein